MANPIDLTVKLVELQIRLETGHYPDSTWPTEQTFKDAHVFLLNLNPIEIIPPSIGIADDGEINFYWKFDEILIDLGFYGNGTYSYFAQDSEGMNYHGDDLDVNTFKLPDTVLNLIKQGN